jgi:hypothetical protein
MANNIAKYHEWKKLSEFKKKGRINITNITEKSVEIYLCTFTTEQKWRGAKLYNNKTK